MKPGSFNIDVLEDLTFSRELLYRNFCTGKISRLSLVGLGYFLLLLQ
jgi:hypothetical protein